MEANPLASVDNNVLGTRAVADVAIAHGVERFVLVSTDKALNPYSVYGQTKTLCEWIVGSHGERDDVPTKFVAVRFGNVLNSAGSVIPLFRRQIERGGPVTVTDPEMTRFFMTIPEAVALVIEAGAIGGRAASSCSTWASRSGSSTSRNMIRLSGKGPSGTSRSRSSARGRARRSTRALRPGRDLEADDPPKIVALDVSRSTGRGSRERLDELARLVEAGDTLELVGQLAAIVRGPQARRRRNRRRGDRDTRLRVRLGAARPGIRQQAELAAVTLVGERAAHSSSITSVPAWTSTRNAPGPKMLDASTMPLDSHAPGAAAPRPRRWALVGRLLTFAATRFVPVARSYCQMRAVVAAGSKFGEPGTSEPGGNWLDQVLLDQQARWPSTPGCPAGGSR